MESDDSLCGKIRNSVVGNHPVPAVSAVKIIGVTLSLRVVGIVESH